MRPPNISLGLKIAVIGCSVCCFVLLAGCETATTGAKIEARIQEMPEVFAQLPKAAQQAIRWGYVKKGFNPVMVYMALGQPAKTEVSKDKARVMWTYYDDTVVSQDVAMRTAAAENGTAYHTGGISVPGAGTTAVGAENTEQHVMERTGGRGAKGLGQSYYDMNEHTARVLVFYDHGKVTDVKRIESTPREKTFEDALRSFNNDTPVIPEGDVQMGEASEVTENKKDE